MWDFHYSGIVHVANKGVIQSHLFAEVEREIFDKVVTGNYSSTKILDPYWSDMSLPLSYLEEKVGPIIPATEKDRCNGVIDMRIISPDSKVRVYLKHFFQEHEKELYATIVDGEYKSTMILGSHWNEHALPKEVLEHKVGPHLIDVKELERDMGRFTIPRSDL